MKEEKRLLSLLPAIINFLTENANINRKEFAEKYTELPNSTFNDTLRKLTLDRSSLDVLYKMKNGIINYGKENGLKNIITPLDPETYFLYKALSHLDKLRLIEIIIHIIEKNKDETTISLSGHDLRLKLVELENLIIEDLFIGITKEDEEIIIIKNEVYEKFEGYEIFEKLEELVNDSVYDKLSCKPIYVPVISDMDIEIDVGESEIELTVEDAGGISSIGIKYGSLKVLEDLTATFEVEGEVFLMTTGANDAVTSFTCKGKMLDGEMSFSDVKLYDDYELIY